MRFVTRKWTLVGAFSVAWMSQLSLAQVPATEAAAIRAKNADVTARSIGLAIAVYLDARATGGEDLGVHLCDASIKTGILPSDSRALGTVAQTVGVMRRVPCGAMPGDKSEVAGSVRVDSVSLSIREAVIYATIRRGGSAHQEVATLQPTGWGKERRWNIVDIKTPGPP